MTTKRDPFRLSRKDSEDERIIKFLDRAVEMREQNIAARQTVNLD